MKTILYTISIIALIFTIESCDLRAVRGNGNIISKEIAVSDYNEIEFSGEASLIYEQKPDVAAYLRIEIDENLFPLLSIESSGDVLNIKNKERIQTTQYNIYTNSTRLARLAASGLIKAHVKGKLETENLNFSVAGSGNITADSIIANTITSRVSGSGDIIMKGKANRIDSSISGSGKTIAVDMPADTVICNVSGSGNFTVYAEKYLEVKVSGSGDVVYKGDPKINQSISGSGKVIRMN